MATIQKTKPYPFERVTDPEIIKKIHNHPEFVKQRKAALELYKIAGSPYSGKRKRKTIVTFLRDIFK